MDKIKEFLSGKKTYLGGIAMILIGINAWVNGSATDIEAIRTIIEGIIVMTGRAAISKIDK